MPCQGDQCKTAASCHVMSCHVKVISVKEPRHVMSCQVKVIIVTVFHLFLHVRCHELSQYFQTTSIGEDRGRRNEAPPPPHLPYSL